MVQWFCLLSWRLFDVCTSYFGSMNQYDPTFDLKINVGHCDLYSMVQWFCLISWRLYDVWTILFGIMSPYDPKFDLKINISWSSDFALYLEDYMDPWLTKGTLQHSAICWVISISEVLKITTFSLFSNRFHLWATHSGRSHPLNVQILCAKVTWMLPWQPYYWSTCHS